MIQLHWIFPLIACVMIAALGGWIFHERCARMRALKNAEHERERIRVIAEDAASTATSCAASINLIDFAPRPPRRQFQVVRDDHNGISRWEWR